MSTCNPSHIVVPQPDPFDPLNIRSMNVPRHNSQGSLSSNGSYSPNDCNWDPVDKEDLQVRRASKRGVSTFIIKLFGMVSDTSNQHLISWNPSGTSFLVCNTTAFSQKVLPEHFKHSNFSSFVRQLNMYGFHKINKSPRGQKGNSESEILEFSHPKFQRDRPGTLKDIKRKVMDSELLRRETGDIHASFSVVQFSQADLLLQFRVLQENFSNLLQGFEEMKKVQLQQQIIIKKLSEYQRYNYEEQNNMNQPSLFITSPYASPLKSWEQPQQVVMSPIYDNNKNDQFSFSMNPLPPSPVSSVLLSSSSSYEGPQRKKQVSI